MDEPLTFSDEESVDIYLGIPASRTRATSTTRVATLTPTLAATLAATLAPAPTSAFAESLKEWIYDEKCRDKVLRETKGLSTGACVSRLLREMFSEDTLAEHTYGGKKINGVSSQGLARKADTKQLLESVRTSAQAFSPFMKPVDFSNHVNDCCQKIRAKRKHAFEVLARLHRLPFSLVQTTFYSYDLGWNLRGSLYERTSKFLHEHFEEDVREGRLELKRRLDDFRRELTDAEDDQVELWNEIYADRLGKEPPLKIQRSQHRTIRSILS
jgi:hypothetical protein